MTTVPEQAIANIGSNTYGGCGDISRNVMTPPVHFPNNKAYVYCQQVSYLTDHIVLARDGGPNPNPDPTPDPTPNLTVLARDGGPLQADDRRIRRAVARWREGW